MEFETQVINNRKRTLGKITIVYNGKEEIVRIKRLNFGEYNQLQKSCTKITLIGGQPKLDIDQTVMNEQALVRSLIDAPFPINIEEVQNLERNIAEVILGAINELNNLDDKKKEN